MSGSAYLSYRANGGSVYKTIYDQLFNYSMFSLLLFFYFLLMCEAKQTMMNWWNEWITPIKSTLLTELYLLLIHYNESNDICSSAIINFWVNKDCCAKKSWLFHHELDQVADESEVKNVQKLIELVLSHGKFKKFLIIDGIVWVMSNIQLVPIDWLV